MVDKLLEFRRPLTRAGLLPSTSAEAEAVEITSRADAALSATPPDLVVVVNHHAAKIYHLDVQSADRRAHVIKPCDPHHFRHHLTHEDLSRERGQRAPKDLSFYESLSESVALAQAFVVVGHGQKPRGNNLRKPALRRPLPPHLPREAVLQEPEIICACHSCDRSKLALLGEDVTEVLEKIPLG